MGFVAGMAQAVVGDIARRDEDSAAVNEARTNQELAQKAAADAVDRGNIAAGRTRITGDQLVGKQTVAYANSGVDSSVGTAANVQADTQAMSELDARTHENNAAREAWGFNQQADAYGRKIQRITDKQGVETALTATRFAGAALGGVGGGSGSSGGSGGDAG